LLCNKVKWGLGIGDWGLGPIPNPQSPIPKIILTNKINNNHHNNNHHNNNNIINKYKIKQKLI